MKTKKKSSPLLSENGSHSHPAPEDIAVRAHAIWEQQGHPPGLDLEHWLQAEAELRQAAKPDARRE